MPPDVEEKDPLVFLGAALLPLPCDMPGTRYDERKNPDEKVGGRQSFKSEDGRVFAVKTVKPVDEEGAEAVFLKKEEARIRRAEKSRQKKLHGVE